MTDFPQDDWDGDRLPPEDDNDSDFGEEGNELPQFLKDRIIDAGFELEDFDGFFVPTGSQSPFADLDGAGEIRGNRFSSLEDAVNYLIDTGVLNFFGIIQIQENVFAIFEDYPEP